MKTNPDSRPIIEIGEANFKSEVLRWKQPVLVNNSTGITQQSNLICYARLPRKGKVMNRFSNRTVIANPNQGFNQFRTVFRTFKFLTPHNCSLQTSSDVSHEPVTRFASHLARALPKGF